MYKNKTKKRDTRNILIGCHASTIPTILNSIKYVNNIGGNVVQIFLGSNRSSSLKLKTKLTKDDILLIRNFLQHSAIMLFIHSVYVLNFCKAMPGSGIVQYMHNNIQWDLQIGSQLGAKGVILHLGFKTTLELNIAMRNLIANINKIIDEMPDNIMLILETSAGSGTQLGYTLEELTTIWVGIKYHYRKTNRIGICIDTAHIYVSGYDISNVIGIKKYLEMFNKLIGWKYITNFHINDSRYSLGAKKDEHRGIGLGVLYNTNESIKALKYIKKFCYINNIPMVLETHGAGSINDQGYKNEIDMIKKL